MLDRKQIRAILLYEYKNGMKASDVSRCLNNVFGPGTISDRTVQWWFTKFKGGDESLEDETRSGRPSEVDLELLGKIVDEKPNISSRELAQMMNVSHTTVVKKLKEVKKLKGYAENEMMLLAADQSTEQGCRPKEEVCKLTEQSHKAMEQSHKPLEHSVRSTEHGTEIRLQIPLDQQTVKPSPQLPNQSSQYQQLSQQLEAQLSQQSLHEQFQLFMEQQRNGLKQQLAQLNGPILIKDEIPRSESAVEQGNSVIQRVEAASGQERSSGDKVKDGVVKFD